ncbi:hypothetical protein VNO78_28157 [Psophocarpus tetragonolobus]|uniref:Uncharacterized protein n=1 Tax=Psophocarpus tetragonolobus TaxID=3891 RepID=A0AAN9XBC3_PSOTE
MHALLISLSYTLHFHRCFELRCGLGIAGLVGRPVRVRRGDNRIRAWLCVCSCLISFCAHCSIPVSHSKVV